MTAKDAAESVAGQNIRRRHRSHLGHQKIRNLTFRVLWMRLAELVNRSGQISVEHLLIERHIDDLEHSGIRIEEPETEEVEEKTPEEEATAPVE